MLRRKWSDIPFVPARVPLYYGWIILVLGSLGFVASVPGQTVGVSVFTDFLIRDLGLSRVHLSLAYLFGTLSSAFLLTFAGRVYDRLGARVVGTVVALFLGAHLLVLSKADVIVAGLDRLLAFLPTGLPAFLFMIPGFFLLRFFGQGVMTLVSRNMVMKWFRARRGLANGILGVFMAFAFSYSPKLLNTLVESLGWQGSWFWMGLVIGIGFALIFALLARDNPASCSLEPDGKAPVVHKRKRKEVQRTGDRLPPVRDYTLPEARRSYVFWIYTMALFLSGLFLTAFTFHVVSIFETIGMNRLQAVSVFLPTAVVSVIVNLAASWASDYTRIKYLLLIHIAGVLLSLVALIRLGPGLMYVLLILGNGISGGTFGLLSTVTWPRFFGLSHLGAISGYSTGWIIAGSAVGPYLFSLSLEHTGSYVTVGYACLVVGGVLLVLALKANPPDQREQPARSAEQEDNS
jgi:MFS family permease